jgi:hypothetical protein
MLVQGPLNSYSGIQANGRTSATTGDPLQGLPPDIFAPHQIPILHGNSYAPTGQPNNVVRNYAGKLGLSGFSRNYNEAPDCQPGQTGYALGDLRVPGQAASNPSLAVSDMPGSRGPTTLFYTQDGTRQLRDTRVSGRYPNP